MLATDEMTETAQKTTLEESRMFLKLPLEERRRQLAEQAEKLLEHYEREKPEREAWQGGDIVEF